MKLEYDILLTFILFKHWITQNVYSLFMFYCCIIYEQSQLGYPESKWVICFCIIVVFFLYPTMHWIYHHVFAAHFSIKAFLASRYQRQSIWACQNALQKQPSLAFEYISLKIIVYYWYRQMNRSLLELHDYLIQFKLNVINSAIWWNNRFIVLYKKNKIEV